MMPQPNELWDELLAGYVLGDLTPEEATQVKQYLDAHPERVSEVKALQATLSLLPLALPETRLSPALGAELAQAAENIALKMPERAVSLRRTDWKRWMVAIGGIAATLAIAGLGSESYRLRNELSISQANLKQQSKMTALAQESSNRLFVLRTTSKTQTVSGSLVVAPKSELIILAIQNLEPLPTGQVYRLWALSHGKKMNCIDFSANPQGQVFLQMPLDDLLVHTPTVFITVESSETHAAPKGTTVMLGSQPI